jgi:hypothetical protein
MRSALRGGLRRARRVIWREGGFETVEWIAGIAALMALLLATAVVFSARGESVAQAAIDALSRFIGQGIGLHTPQVIIPPVGQTNIFRPIIGVPDTIVSAPTESARASGWMAWLTWAGAILTALWNSRGALWNALSSVNWWDELWKEREWAWYRDFMKSWRDSGWFGWITAAIVGLLIEFVTGLSPDGKFSIGWTIISIIGTLLIFAEGVGLLQKIPFLLKALGLGKLFQGGKFLAWLKNLGVVKWLLSTRAVRWIATKIDDLIKWFRNPKNIDWIKDIIVDGKWGALIDEFRRLVLPRLIKLRDWLLKLPLIGSWLGKIGQGLIGLASGVAKLAGAIHSGLSAIINSKFIQGTITWMQGAFNWLKKLPLIGPVLRGLEKVAVNIVEYFKTKAAKFFGNLAWYITRRGPLGVVEFFFKWLFKDIFSLKQGSFRYEVVLALRRLFVFKAARDIVQWIVDLWQKFFPPATPPTIPPVTPPVTPTPPTIPSITPPTPPTIPPVTPPTIPSITPPTPPTIPPVTPPTIPSITPPKPPAILPVTPPSIPPVKP